MPKLWIGDKMYSVESDVRDYCEKLEERINELETQLEEEFSRGVKEGLNQAADIVKNC